MDPGKTAPREQLIPNLKARLREQVREVMRFHHYSIRMEESYWQWIKRFILFHAKRHPKEMGAAEVSAYLSHLTAANDAAKATQQQALYALVFLYGKVLLQPLGQLPEFRQSRRPPRLPEVFNNICGYAGSVSSSATRPREASIATVMRRPGSETDQSRIIAYHCFLASLRSRFAKEPAAPMFSRLAIQFKVIVVSARGRRAGLY